MSRKVSRQILSQKQKTNKAKEDNALPVWLKGAGYTTALIGKYQNRYGQQSPWGAWLAWAGSLLNISFKGTTIGNPRDWVPITPPTF
jgi:hypothetical protein